METSPIILTVEATRPPHALRQCRTEPVESFLQAVASERTARLDQPFMILYLIERVDFNQFIFISRGGHIGFIGED